MPSERGSDPPGELQGRFLLAVARWRTDASATLTELRSLCRAALRANDSSLVLRCLACLAILCFGMGRYRASIAYYKFYLRRAGPDGLVYIQMARAHEQMGQQERAEELYTRAEKFGFASRKIVEQRRAGKHFNPFHESVCRGCDEEIQTRVDLALAYSEMGLWHDAISEIKVAMGMNQHASCTQWLASLLDEFSAMQPP